MSYLDPPPAPAPVIVMKDVGGLVRDYQTQTDYYRRTDREVRVHECHSACTLALSLPNVCVYPDSIFKFHQAYNAIDRQTDLGVSAQLFDSYPATVRARLGTLTRAFKIMRGTELIALGIRDCNTPRTITASREPVPQTPSIGTVWSDVMSSFGNKPTSTVAPSRATLVATRRQTGAEKSRTPQGALAEASQAVPQTAEANIPEMMAPSAKSSSPATVSGVNIPAPPRRPEHLGTMTLAAALIQPMPAVTLPKVMNGAQPILPPHFLAYAIVAQAASTSPQINSSVR